MTFFFAPRSTAARTSASVAIYARSNGRAVSFDTVAGAVRRFLARRKLQRMVDRERNSYECRRYRERRAAALKALR